MAFKTSSTVSTASTNQDRPQVDFKALVFGECFG